MRRRTKNQLETLALLGVIAAGIVVIVWLYSRSPEDQTAEGQPTSPAGGSASTTSFTGPTAPRPGATTSPVATVGPEPQAGGPKPDPAQQSKAHELFQQGLEALDKQKWVQARTLLNQGLTLGLRPVSETDAMRKLEELAEKTIFAPRGYPYPDDPVVATHTIEPRQTLEQLEGVYWVPYMILQRINGIGDPKKIIAGQRIKVIAGPFHAIVDKSEFRLYLYVHDLFVKSFHVGLGEDNSTPAGTWVVGQKKGIKPPFTHPRTGQLLTADSPDYPLGTRWIPLEGVSGDAAGAVGYGIHGTNEPESIGRQSSLGCIRMKNEDVEFVYDCLLVKHSKVFVRN